MWMVPVRVPASGSLAPARMVDLVGPTSIGWDIVPRGLFILDI